MVQDDIRPIVQFLQTLPLQFSDVDESVHHEIEHQCKQFIYSLLELEECYHCIEQELQYYKDIVAPYGGSFQVSAIIQENDKFHKILDNTATHVSIQDLLDFLSSTSCSYISKSDLGWTTPQKLFEAAAIASRQHPVASLCTPSTVNDSVDL